MTLSIRWRLTLWVVALMTAALTAFGAGVLWLQGRWTRVELDAGLANVAATAARMIDEEFAENGNLARAVGEVRASLNVPGLATAVLDAHGRPITAHWHGFDASRVADDARQTDHAVFLTAPAGATPWRVLLAPEHTPGGAYALLIARPMDDVNRQRSTLTRVLLVAGSSVVLMAGVLSWWVASSALRPVTVMAQEAHAITADTPDWRLDGATASDELGQLARAFNALLARLAQSAKTQRDFMADASHELRTPVSVIKTAAEVTLDRDTRDEEEYRDALTIIEQQSNRLSRLVEDMFVLARADADGQAIVMGLTDLSAVVAECCRAASVVAAAKHIQLSTRIEPERTVVGNDSLLRRLVTNLLDNALQYTPNGGAVDVAVTRAGSAVTLTVADTGPGIPVHERERIFERFVRLDEARSESAGAGLGLPIARWIARGHNATLFVEERKGGGSVFTFRMAIEVV
ncbi:MAG TPA: ATP-binding protein [Vicinamibacterales bacterium]|nr:ATP-binding protein [Vicinamibacterales bacterium]